MLSELATDTIVEIINDIIDNIDNKNVNEKNIYIYFWLSSMIKGHIPWLSGNKVGVHRCK